MPNFLLSSLQNSWFCFCALGFWCFTRFFNQRILINVILRRCKYLYLWLLCFLLFNFTLPLYHAFLFVCLIPVLINVRLFFLLLPHVNFGRYLLGLLWHRLWLSLRGKFRVSGPCNPWVILSHKILLFLHCQELLILFCLFLYILHRLYVDTFIL